MMSTTWHIYGTTTYHISALRDESAVRSSTITVHVLPLFGVKA